MVQNITEVEELELQRLIQAEYLKVQKWLVEWGNERVTVQNLEIVRG